MHRNGRTAEAFFTFSYSPVRTESGEVGGALINGFETTLQVQARALEAERDRLLGSLRFERSRLEYVFQNAPAFLAVLRGEEHVFELANHAYYRLVGQRDLLGMPVREALPEAVSQGFTDRLDDVLRTGTPFIGAEPVRPYATGTNRCGRTSMWNCRIRGAKCFPLRPAMNGVLLCTGSSSAYPRGTGHRGGTRGWRGAGFASRTTRAS